MNFTRKAMATPVTDLSTFIGRHGSTLPRTVKVEEGFCGTNAEDTLEAEQILVFFKVERQRMIIALDQFNQELCVPRDTRNKVQVLPFEYYCEHNTVQELINAHQTPYLCVLEDISSLQISAETTLKLLSNRPIQGVLKCEVVDLYDAKEVQLPLQLAGRFQPLLDAREYYLEEVLAQYELPVNIRFVSQSRANDDVCARPLSSLENIHLVRDTEVEMVFAASVDEKLSLNLFPRTLDISVSCGFKVTADTSKKIKGCRQTLEAGAKTLKRLNQIAINSCYFTACPVRRFNFESLQPPSISIRKTTGVSQAEFLSTGKQCETAEEVYINRDVTKRDLAQCLQSASKSGVSFEVEAADYENCDIDAIFNNSDVSKTTEKYTDEAPPLPPKMRSRSTTEDATTQPSPQNSCRPVPKPRKRVGTPNKGNKENVAATLTKSHTGNSFEDDAKGTCPESPPRPEFLNESGIDDKEDISVSREDDTPRLTPGTSSQDDAEGTCPESPPRPKFLNENGIDEKEDINVSREGPPPLTPGTSSDDDAEETYPELPPRPAFLIASGIDDKEHINVSREEGPPSLTSATSSEDDAEETRPELPPRPPFLLASRIEDLEDNDLSRSDRPPPLPPRCPGPSDFGYPAYLVVDVADWRAVEEKALNRIKDDDERSSDVENRNSEVSDSPYVDFERPEREGVNGRPYVDMESHERIGVNGIRRDRENSHPVDVIRPGENRASEQLKSPRFREAARANEGDVARKFEEESSEEDWPYEEVDVQRPSSPKGHRSKENTVNEEKAEPGSSSKNLRSKKTQGSSDARPHRAVIPFRHRNPSDMIISNRREEDWMDFRDIDQLFKLKKQLDEALVKQADVQKQVNVTKETLTFDESQTQQPPANTGSASEHIGSAQYLDMNIWDKNQNRLDSSDTFCKPQPPKSTQVATRSKSPLFNKKAVDPEKKVEEKTPRSKSPLSSLAPENNGPANTTYGRECSALTSVQERGEFEKPHVTISDDDDDYEECFDRKYVNHQTGIRSSFANESHYLQLENPSDDKDEEVYVNVDAEESDKMLGTDEPNAQKATVILENSGLKEPPPLPPKKRASSLRDAE
ncbi:hypothetical protein ACROYT_G011930 [Oculina patagonica]